MNLDLFKKIIGDMKSMPGIKLLRYCGTGESTFNKQFLDMVKFAHEAGVAERAEVLTNAVLLSDYLAKELPKYLNRIVISIEGLDDNEYKDFTLTNVSFEKLVNNIKTLYEHKSDCKLHVKIHNHTANTEEKIQRFFDIFKPIADEVYVENLVSMWPEVSSEKSNLGLDAGFRFGGEIVKRNVCVQIFKSMLINANGQVVPCCVDFKRVNVIGDVRTDALSDIWRGKAMHELQLRHLKGLKIETRPCNECTMNDYGDPDNIDEFASEILNRISN